MNCTRVPSNVICRIKIQWIQCITAFITRKSVGILQDKLSPWVGNEEGKIQRHHMFILSGIDKFQQAGAP